MMTEQSFTTIGQKLTLPFLPATRSDWEALRSRPDLAGMASRINAGEEGLKRLLPAWTPGVALFRDNRRQDANILQGLPRLMMDFDQKGLSDEILRRARWLDQRGTWRVLMVERSVRGGTHVLVRLPAGMTPETALQSFSRDIGFEADKAVKDRCRAIFMVPADHTLYVDDELFRPEGDSTPPAIDLSFPGIDLSFPVPDFVLSVFPDRPEEVPEAEKAPEKAEKADPAGEDPVPAFKGVPYADIIREWQAEQGGEPAVGERNTRLYQMARHLCAIADCDEALLLRVMPRYGLDEKEMKSLIHSAAKSESRFVLTRGMKAVLARLGVDTAGAGPIVLQEPPMPQKLPRLVNLLLQNTPAVYRPAVAQGIFPALGVYLNQVSYEFIDHKLMESALMTLVIAPTSTGKSCIDDVISHITADLRARDALNRQQEEDWKADCAALGANETRAKRQKYLIQCVQPDMTSAALLQRMADAGGRFLFSQLDEVESLNKLGDNKFLVLKYAFDTAEFGAERVGEKSVSKVCRTRYNWVASTTPGRARKFFAKVLTDGPMSRLNLATIPPREIGAPMPVYGRYTEKFDRDLAPFLRHLEAATGQVRCRQALELASALQRELSDNAVAMEDKVYENLSFRANVIGYRKAMILWLANGQKWEKPIEDFVRWSVHYDLYCKMKFFGEAIRQAEADDAAFLTHPGPRNLLQDLPDTFTIDDLKRLKMRLGQLSDRTAMSKQLSKWKERGFITQPDPKLEAYRKLKYLKQAPPAAGDGDSSTDK